MNRKLTSNAKTIYILALAIMTLLALTLPAQAVTYTYDSLNRLTSATYKPGQQITYTYDAGGNMLTLTAVGFDDIPPVTSITLDGQAGKEDWYRSDITVTLAAVDNPDGSGVNKTEYSLDGTTWVEYKAPILFSNEGSTVFYYRSIDKEGNVEANKQATLKIDKTLPVITGAPTTQPNATGWYKEDVTVKFEASDTLSGIDTVTPDTVISTEGANQSVTGTVVDKAGNIASVVISGINLDKTAPVTICKPNREPNQNGWYKIDVQLSLSATDKEGGSGVVKTEYSFDSSNWTTYSTPITISTEGITDIYYRSIDLADNLESSTN